MKEYSTVFFGYRLEDHNINLPLVNNIALGTLIRLFPNCPIYKDRKFVCRSMGCASSFSMEPHVDCSDTKSAMYGAVYRNGRKMPSNRFRRELRLFAQKFCSENFEVLKRILTFDEWLDKTDYPEWRKAELRQIKDDLGGFSLHNLRSENRSKYKSTIKVNCFVKDEHYPEYKHARGIYARSDSFKVIFGRYIKSMELIIYELPFFIKHVPVANRAQFILDALSGKNNFFGSDFSCFESHSTREMYEDVIEIFYRHMTKN